MTRQRKDYSLHIAPELEPKSVLDGPCPWIWSTSVLKLDFKRWQHAKGDYSQPLVDRGELLDQCRNALWAMRHELEENSIVTLYENGLKMLLLFTEECEQQIRKVEHITEEFILSLVFWLKNGRNKETGNPIAYATARRRYDSIKTILMYYCRYEMFDKRLLPVNPFPNVNRTSKGVDPYSKPEMQRIMKVLYLELKAIRNGSSTRSQRIETAVYALLVLAKTGLNKTPLLEASRDCLSPHPLKPDMAMVLTTYKRRGMNTHSLSLRGGREISSMDSLPNSVADLIKEISASTESLMAEAPLHLQNRIWLFRNEVTAKVTCHSDSSLINAASFIASEHSLLNDMNEPLKISSKRLRKTFATRIWQLTGGDIWKTARLMGNTPQISDRHYLSVTPEMEKNHRFVGIAMELNARGVQTHPNIIAEFAEKACLTIDRARIVLSGINNTGVARCSDPLHGRYANGDGLPCTRFLHCFRCPNQIVIQDDLHRLFSFYWLIVRERAFIGRKRWKKLYGWLIREIDDEIAPRFSKEIIEAEKHRARSEPHAMWRARLVFGGN